MDALIVNSIIMSLLRKLRERNCWCSETHIQKAIFFLKKIFNMNLGFNYILYKHGPFSFELREMLNEMLAEKFLDLEPMYPYGPSYSIGTIGDKLKDDFAELSKDYENKIAFIASKIDNKRAAELEQLSTALFFITKKPEMSPEQRAKRINEIKPHISFSKAEAALDSVNSIIEEATSI